MTDADGAVEIVAADGGTVIDEGRRTYLRDRARAGRASWSSRRRRGLPEPGPSQWTSSTAGTRTVARPPGDRGRGRRGRDGRPAQRLVVDDATGPAARPRGARPERRGRSARCGSRASTSAPPDDGSALGRRPKVRQAARPPSALAVGPRRLPRAERAAHGFVLVGASRAARRRCCSSTATVCSPRRCSSSAATSTGASLPGGGTDSQLGDTRTRDRTTRPSGDVGGVGARRRRLHVRDRRAERRVRPHGRRAGVRRPRARPSRSSTSCSAPFGWG